jgi:excisionase family DNA binding protein
MTPRRNKTSFITSLDQVPVVVDVAYVAQLLQINQKTVERCCREGRIRATKIARQWRIPKAEVERICEGGVEI